MKSASVRRLSMAGVGFAIAGCSVVGSIISSTVFEEEDHACVGLLEMPAQIEACSGLLDVTYTYTNGKRPLVGGKPGVAIDDLAVGHYVAQRGENSCYAASLSSAFSQVGASYPQERFEQSIAHECFGTSDNPLTFSQIVFAATKVHLTTGGIWFVDSPDQFAVKRLNALPALPPGNKKVTRYRSGSGMLLFQGSKVCRAANGGKIFSIWTDWSWDFDAWLGRKLHISNRLLTNNAAMQGGMQFGPQKPPVIQYLESVNLYRPVLWSRTGDAAEPQGGFVPVKSAADLIDHLEKKVPVRAGLAGDTYGHVVTVTKVEYLRSIGKPHVEWVTVLDPRDAHRPQSIYSGDEFFKRAQFIFALYNPHAK